MCPLTSGWPEIWWDRNGLGAFFRNHPDHLLCGEVVGDNPYNIQRDPSIPAGLHLRIFDIRNPGGADRRAGPTNRTDPHRTGPRRPYSNSSSSSSGEAPARPDSFSEMMSAARWRF